jgi:two-component system response regulator ChvI
MAKEISFTGSSQNCCVSFVDIVDSTRITTTEIIDNAEKIRKYYSIFINTMAAIIRDFNATIIKNTGDSLVYYFPKTANSAEDMSAFKDVLECGLAMIAAKQITNTKVQKERLPFLNYRISADYGRVELAKSVTSTSDDLFGPTVSLSAKINSMAPVNSMVIGSNLYKIVKKPSFGNDYYFSKAGEYSIDNSEHQYLLYLVTRDKNKENRDTLNIYRNIY